MKKRKNIVLVIFLWLMIATACSLNPLGDLSSNEIDQSETIDSDLIIVGFSQLGSESDWRTANTKSIQNALSKENGFSLIFANGRQRQENQIKDIRSFIFQEVDYIVIAPVTESGWDTVLEEAKKANIPVIIVDRRIDTEDENLYVASVETDKYEEGRKAGLWLEQHLLEQNNTNDDEIDEDSTLVEKVQQEESIDSSSMVNIVILEGTPYSTSQIGRSKGFEEIAQQHDNWNILAHESGDFTKAKGKEVMAKYLREYDDIDVLVSQNDDMTFGAIEAIKEAGLTCGVNGEIAIISFDAVSEAFDKMEEGLINVDIECNPLQGELIAQIIDKLEKGEIVDKVSYVEGKVFEAENASEERAGRSY